MVYYTIVSTFVRGVLIGLVYNLFYQGSLDAIIAFVLYTTLMAVYAPVYDWLKRFDLHMVWGFFVETVGILVDTVMFSMLFGVDNVFWVLFALGVRTALAVHFYDEETSLSLHEGEYEKLISEV